MSRSFKFTISIVLTALVAVVLFQYLRKPAVKTDASAENETIEATQEEMAEPTNPVDAVQAQEAPVQTTPVAIDLAEVSRKFAADMRGLEACFGMPAGSEPSIEPRFENLDSALRSDMGEVVARNEEWSSSYIETPAGEKRLIRTEMNFDGDESSSRRLKYFSVNEDGMLTEIPISQEQTNDPSEALLASLETEGKVTLREKNMRLYYTNGAEVSYLEKDGLLSELEVNFNGKSFRCRKIEDLRGQCRCY